MKIKAIVLAISLAFFTTASAVEITTTAGTFEAVVLEGPSGFLNTFDEVEATLEDQVWWNSQSLAMEFAAAVGPQLGLTSSGGPVFAWSDTIVANQASGCIWNLGPINCGSNNRDIPFNWVVATEVPIDTDGDGVADVTDNCSQASNAAQADADSDGIGNRCDADFNNDCIVNAIDLGLFKAQFFSTQALFDLNNDGVVNAIDLGLLRGAFFGVPGPSGVPNDCAP